MRFTEVTYQAQAAETVCCWCLHWRLQFFSSSKYKGKHSHYSTTLQEQVLHMFITDTATTTTTGVASNED